MHSLQHISFPLEDIEIFSEQSKKNSINSAPFIPELDNEISDHGESPILKKVFQKREDLMPYWFKEITKKCENLGLQKENTNINEDQTSLQEDKKIYENDSHSNSPILKKIHHKKEDLLPSWFKEVNKKYYTFCESLDRVQSNQRLLSEGLKKYDEKKLLAEKKQKQTNYQKKGIFSLSYHIILLIIRMANDEKTGYLKTLLNMMRVNRYLNKLLGNEYVWKTVIQDYLGYEFININEKNEGKPYFWKKIMQYFWENFTKFKKSLIYYKEMKCPLKIDLKSLQKDLGNSLRFMLETNILFLNSKNLYFIPKLFLLYFEFLKKEKIVDILKILTGSSQYFLYYDAVDVMISLINLDSEFEKKVEIDVEKFIRKLVKLYRNHEQELLLYINAKVIYELSDLNLLILSETANITREHNININNWKNDFHLIEQIFNKKINSFGLIYYLNKWKVEKFNSIFTINKESLVEIDMDFIDLKCIISAGGQFKKTHNLGNETMRSLYSGEIVFQGLEMKAYINVIYKKTNKHYVKGLGLYASSADHEAIILIKIC